MRDMRLLIGLGAAVALVVLFLVFRPGGADDNGQAAPTTTAETTITESNGATTTEAVTTAAPKAVQVVVRVRGGKPVDGIVRAQARKGDPVVVIVGSDVSDEVHIHGYDLKGDVAPGMPVRIRFDANLTGRFEIELENRGEQIAQLTVLP
jgi:nucleotide-binding universal stress UspA family protein